MAKTSATAKRGRTVLLPCKKNAHREKWEKWCRDNCKASAGPYPNITGMREKYWGEKALIVKCGAYIYLMKSYDDGKPLPFE